MIIGYFPANQKVISCYIKVLSKGEFFLRVEADECVDVCLDGKYFPTGPWIACARWIACAYKK